MPRVAIVGAGIGGLAAALLLAARGLDVTVLERADGVGGKLRQIDGIDAGPTVLTMKHVLEGILAEAGETLSAHLVLKPAEILARHAWDSGTSLDLFADLDRSADAVGAMAGRAEARAFLEFSAQARRIHDTLDDAFMRRPKPGLWRLIRDVPAPALFGIDPFTSLWRAAGDTFKDARLQQLFGRYATYCGSSPFLAPATLMLVAHVERSGVWLVEGGMARIASVLRTLAERSGARFRTGCAVEEIMVANGRCQGVRLESGETVAAGMVLCNADVAALSQGSLGSDATGAVRRIRGRRSFSAMTIACRARTGGFPLSRHTVFFSRDYRREFAELGDGRLPGAPTVYVCAQDRNDLGALSTAPTGRRDGDAERLLLVINAPATGDRDQNERELRQCETASFAELRRCGLTMEQEAGSGWITGPGQFARMFPSTGGGLYGQASHGWMASFRRPGVRSRLPGLYLAGGSTHPGPGLSMAALSGQMAAAAMLQDCASTSRSAATAIAGGTSTR